MSQAAADRPMPSIEQQREFWNWHWGDWRERRTLNPWKDLRNATIVGYLRGCGLRGGRLLDLGCGPGHYTQPLTEFGAVTAIDLSTDAIATACAKYPEVEFHAGDLYEHPLPFGAFDAVVAQEVFDHVSDQSKLIARARALLRPGGYFAFSCTNRFAVERLAPGAFPEQPPEHIARPLHGRELREMLQAHFDVLKMTSILAGVGARGVFRIVNSVRLNRLAAATFGTARVERAKCRAGLGYQWIVLARGR